MKMAEQLTIKEYDFLEKLTELIRVFEDETGFYVAEIDLRYAIQNKNNRPAAVLMNAGMKTGSKGMIISEAFKRMQSEQEEMIKNNPDQIPALPMKKK